MARHFLLRSCPAPLSAALWDSGQVCLVTYRSRSPRLKR